MRQAYCTMAVGAPLFHGIGAASSEACTAVGGGRRCSRFPGGYSGVARALGSGALLLLTLTGTGAELLVGLVLGSWVVLQVKHNVPAKKKPVVKVRAAATVHRPFSL